MTCTLYIQNPEVNSRTPTHKLITANLRCACTVTNVKRRTESGTEKDNAGFVEYEEDNDPKAKRPEFYRSRYCSLGAVDRSPVGIQLS